MSKELLSAAITHPNIEYREAPAEASGIAANSVDLITVAQAIHWFDFERFWEEVNRVLAPEGILAFWGYLWPEVNDAVDSILGEFRELISAYWPERSVYLRESYANVTPPLVGIDAPRFRANVQWNAHDYLSHLESWSGTRYYRASTTTDLVSEFEGRFRKAWLDRSYQVSWPLILKGFKKA